MYYYFNQKKFIAGMFVFIKFCDSFLQNAENSWDELTIYKAICSSAVDTKIQRENIHIYNLLVREKNNAYC